MRIETDSAPAVLAPGHVVAVNVYPMPMGPVGVRWDGDNAYAFPLRTATQTNWMKPTELAMLMVPDIRRAAILLDSIPMDQRHGIHLLYGDRNKPLALVGAIKEIDPRLTSFTMKIGGDDASMTGKVVTLPIDCVRSVWRRQGTYWNIAVAGTFAHDRDRGLIFFPG